MRARTSGVPVSLIVGLVCVAVALGMLTAWALLAFGVALFVVGAWELRP